jgi:hypothetical protein
MTVLAHGIGHTRRLPGRLTRVGSRRRFGYRMDR